MLNKQEVIDYYASSNKYYLDLKTHNEFFLRPYIDFVCKYAPKGSKILDLGCGPVYPFVDLINSFLGGKAGPYGMKLQDKPSAGYFLISWSLLGKRVDPVNCF